MGKISNKMTTLLNSFAKENSMSIPRHELGKINSVSSAKMNFNETTEKGKVNIPRVDIKSH